MLRNDIKRVLISVTDKKESSNSPGAPDFGWRSSTAERRAVAEKRGPVIDVRTTPAFRDDGRELKTSIRRSRGLLALRTTRDT